MPAVIFFHRLRKAWCLLLTLSLFFLASCQMGSVRKDSAKKKPTFQKSVQQFIDELWTINPGFAARLGLKEFEGKLVVPDEKSRERQLNFVTKYQRIFLNFNGKSLSSEETIDRDLILNALARTKWESEVFQAWQWNPSMYNLGYMIGGLLQGKKDDEFRQLQKVGEILQKGPAYYKAAQNNITQPTKAYLDFAILQNKGTLKFFENQLRPQIEKSKNLARKSDLKSKILKDLKKTENSITQYIQFLNALNLKLIQEKGFRDFRIGTKLYTEKFKFELQAKWTPKEIYLKALKDRSETHQRMIQLTTKLWGQYFPNVRADLSRLDSVATLIKKISLQHSKAENFIEDVRKQIPKLAEFVRKKDLLYLDPSKPLKVRATPEYMRGFAGASIDAPGPFDPGRETFYNVSPLGSMTSEKQESWLKEYNDYTLQILNIHEAIPGHYTQLVYDNKSPSLIKTIFHNGAMVEGWAVYAERLMIEAGYGAGTPELELMYWKWFLRVVTNTIIDYEIHNKGLKKEDALKAMIGQAFQEKAEAEKKWHRATVSQVQLTYYYTGFSEIYAFRDKIKNQEKENFSLKKFNEKFLNFGSAPVKSIETLWNEAI